MRISFLRVLGGTCGLLLSVVGCSNSAATSHDGSIGHGGSSADARVASGGTPGTTSSGGAAGSSGLGRGGADGAAGSGGSGLGDSGAAGGTTGIPRDAGAGTGGGGAGGVTIDGSATGGTDASIAGAGGRDASGTDASIAGAGGRDASGTDGGGGKGGIDAGGTGGILGTGGIQLDGGGSTGIDGGCGPSATAPAVTRGGQYFGFPEKFNRYYTDCSWQPSSTVYVSPTGSGDGSSSTSPTSVATALAAVVPGRKVVFTAGTYSGCFELGSDQSGTYDNPIVLVGERKADGSPAATINCCSTGRKTCINLEAADYVAVDGFELVGGDYGLRSVGSDYPADQHQKGVAVLNNVDHGQNKDPFFTGQSDWFVIEHCTGYDSGPTDGHGIYLSNGSDWNIARYNETYNTSSSDFQINADPLSTCDVYDDPECDAVAGSSTTGGRGASDFMLVDSNFFHHSKAQGPNFTSVRNSLIKNNIFALPATHGTSFWQETDNPKLGSSNNVVAHNLFITQANGDHAVQFIVNSTGNQFKNNVVVAVTISGTTISANPQGLLLDTDSTTVQANTFEHNAWISGYFDSEDSSAPYAPNANELRLTTFQASWFGAFPTGVGHDPAAFAPTATAPWLDLGNLLPEVPTDRDGAARHAPVDLGPFER